MKKTTEDREIENDITMENTIKDLEKAKKNTQTLLDEPNASVDFHGLSYWAERVESLRNIIKNSL
jgi:hypothetical protein